MNLLIESTRQSLFNIEIQKKVAVCMWNYVREHLDELHDMLSDDEIDSGNIDYGYDAVEEIKKKFAREFFKDTGIVINWASFCILCENFKRLRIESCKAGHAHHQMITHITDLLSMYYTGTAAFLHCQLSTV